MADDHPIFGPNRIKLGLFCMNTMPALTMAKDLFAPVWSDCVTLARMADDAGLEALVPIARWKGYVDDAFDHPSNDILDPFTFAAGIPQATRHIGVFATTHASMAHPLQVAKQAATIDMISGGRFAMNVVGGWNRREFEMFGIDLLGHEERYVYLAALADQPGCRGVVDERARGLRLDEALLLLDHQQRLVPARELRQRFAVERPDAADLVERQPEIGGRLLVEAEHRQRLADVAIARARRRDRELRARGAEDRAIDAIGADVGDDRRQPMLDDDLLGTQRPEPADRGVQPLGRQVADRGQYGIEAWQVDVGGDRLFDDLVDAFDRDPHDPLCRDSATA